MARAHAGSLIRCLWFWLWALDGALAVSSLDVGPLAAGPALLLTALLASREASRGPRTRRTDVPGDRDDRHRLA
jgi:hypothetical protein